MNTIDYQGYYEIVKNLACSASDLHRLKCKYGSEINSRRRLDDIRTLPELLRVLQKRNCINSTNVEILNEISRVLRQPVQEFVPEYNVPPCVAPEDPLERAYYVIATNIGHKWQEFARALDIPEGQIDKWYKAALEPGNRGYEIISYHRQACLDERQFLMTLLEGLGEVRRHDLRQKVQNLILMR